MWGEMSLMNGCGQKFFRKGGAAERLRRNLGTVGAAADLASCGGGAGQAAGRTEDISPGVRSDTRVVIEVGAQIDTNRRSSRLKWENIGLQRGGRGWRKATAF